MFDPVFQEQRCVRSCRPEVIEHSPPGCPQRVIPCHGLFRDRESRRLQVREPGVDVVESDLCWYCPLAKHEQQLSEASSPRSRFAMADVALYRAYYEGFLR